MRLQLRVVSGPQAGEQCEIEPPVGYVGRGEECALHLRDPSVSLSHLELRYQHDGWWALQRSARSPSLLDGTALGSQPAPLHVPSGVLQVGSISVEYRQEQSASLPAPDSPPTLINVRRQLPSIQHAVLQRMEPLRAAEPPPAEEAPATLILRRQPATESTPAALPLPAAQDSQPPPPPTLIRRPQTSLGATSPERHGVIPPVPPTLRHSESSAAMERTEAATTKPPVSPAALHALEQEREELRRERDQLRSELARLREENVRLQKITPAAVSPEAPAWASQALSLLEPFTSSLEQASAALHKGNPASARAHLREASFGLADLRDLFESHRT